ncbi:MAG: amino acid permease [Myxococcaceae bacterium]|jgi:APA family basic amino acid/polyamine antiporter|nr:amino acid permease [Myxococcaceae bacterium]MCA3013573.1 amino acid permease [Myxococcaceae bacterium]
MSQARAFGLWSGMGLVVANMVGAGVFLSTGFMAQSMGPGTILLAWVVGGVLALAGARAYAEVARLVPAGGGEYRYVGTLLHPALGYVAGWGSLLVGFSAPIALDALAAGAFVRVLFPALEPRVVGGALIVALTLLHAVGLHLSARVQNGLVVVKGLLLLGFVAVGLTQGSTSWPTWAPPSTDGETLSGFASSLFYIAFAYSGWNAAVYAADDFRDPERTVPRAMVLGCGAVMALYVVVNFIFVANLTPEQGTVVFRYDAFTSGAGQFEQVTLGQAVMAQLLGAGAAKVMSAVTVVLFVSAISAMTFVGPRVTAVMARDGVLPRVFAGREGQAPTGAVLLQGALSLLVLFTHELRTVLANVGAILVLFAAMTVVGLFRLSVRPLDGRRPSAMGLAAALVYFVTSAWMLTVGFSSSGRLLVKLGTNADAGLDATLSALAALEVPVGGGGLYAVPSLGLWLGVIFGAGLVGWAVTRVLKARLGA